jgi:large subunit ribosomal protein L25
MSQRVELNVEPRSIGKANSRALRVGKKIPAVVYGSVKPVNLVLDENTVIKYSSSKYENALFNLKGQGVDGVVALMKAVQINPLTRRPLHVDLFALDLKKSVRVSVEVRLEGKPIGLAEGGLLNVVNRTVEIECLPTEIPESFVADISGMGIGDVLHASDLKVPENIKIISNLDLTIAVVNLFVEEVVAAPVAAAGDAAAAGAAAPAAGAAAPAAGAAAPAAGAKAPAAGKDKK